MLLELLRFPALGPGTAVFILNVLAGGGSCDDSCRSRRCLAEKLINYNLTSQPQNENCTQPVYVPYLEYQTVSVDTKSLRLNTRLQATLIWTDLDLRWNTSVYNYTMVVLPVDSVWTPKLHITNALDTTFEDTSSDLLLYSNGTMIHTVVINADVNCEVNMFNYPFAADSCPVAIQTWNVDGCGTQLTFGTLDITDGSHGDWETETASLLKVSEDRNYIMVMLKMKPSNPFITLMLPSILIILADMISFALPLEGGERNGFKVTLVLSFTMFLSILNDQLPGDSQCSPVIRVHFCVCLVLLVVSMLESLVMTRVANDGSVFFFLRKNRNKYEDTVLGNINVVQLKDSEEDARMLRKVVDFLEALSAKEVKSARCERLAHNIDTVFFWFYSICGTVYFCAMMYIMVRHICNIDHFIFWFTNYD